MPLPSGDAISALVPSRISSAVGTCFVPNLSFNLIGFILFKLPSFFLNLTKNKVGAILSKLLLFSVFIFARVKLTSASMDDVNHFNPFNLYKLFSNFSAIVSVPCLTSDPPFFSVIYAKIVYIPTVQMYEKS